MKFLHGHLFCVEEVNGYLLSEREEKTDIHTMRETLEATAVLGPLAWN